MMIFLIWSNLKKKDEPIKYEKNNMKIKVIDP